MYVVNASEEIKPQTTDKNNLKINKKIRFQDLNTASRHWTKKGDGSSDYLIAHLKKILYFTFFLHQGSMKIKRRRSSLSAFPVQRVTLHNEMLAALQIKVGNVHSYSKNNDSLFISVETTTDTRSTMTHITKALLLEQPLYTHQVHISLFLPYAESSFSV